MMQHVTINGINCEHLSVMDRGLHYGDGLFETIACVAGKLQFWGEHLQRMLDGAERLNMQVETIANFEQDVSAMLKQYSIENGVIKLMLTRGQSERGYRFPSPQKNTRIVIVSKTPEYPVTFKTEGIAACFCQHPVSKNNRLAGIKHLNRLDNVLARNEWKDEYQEGLMLDEDGHVVEGTMSNLFAIKNNELFTPLLNHSGVNGIIREQVLSIAQELGIEILISEIKKEDLKSMGEIFVCNSVIGIWPVKSLGDSDYKIGSLTKIFSEALQKRMHK